LGEGTLEASHFCCRLNNHDAYYTPETEALAQAGAPFSTIGADVDCA
jgi:hypothetical protein